MKQSVRGMAKVSVIWSIAFLMAFLIAVVMFFLTSGELEKWRLLAARAESRVGELTDLNRQSAEDITKISGVVGFYDAQGAVRTDPQRVENTLRGLKDAVPDIGPGIKTLEAAIPIVASAVSSLRQRVTDQESALAAKTSEVDTLQRNVREMGERSSAEISDLRRQMADLEQQRSDTQAEYERQLADLRLRVQTSDSRALTAESSIEANSRKFASEAEAMRARMSEMGRKLTPFVRQPQAADGKVVSVSKDQRLGWLDIGASQRLPLGTRFTVVSGSPGSNRVKAMCEVTRVERNTAEVAFSEVRDPFDPPTAGDVIFNPLYDPRGERHALLIGGFSGQFGRQELESLLAGMGVTVQRGLDRATDFMVVGHELFVDEDNQPVEEPIQPSDLPVYKEALAQGVQVVLLKDLRTYFRF